MILWRYTFVASKHWENHMKCIRVPIIHKKLHTDLIKTLTRNHDNKKWKLDELRKAIRREVEILEVGDNNSYLNDLTNNLPGSPTAAFLTGSEHPSQRNQRDPLLPPARRECVYCKGPHSTNECTIVTDKKKRHDMVYTRSQIVF